MKSAPVIVLNNDEKATLEAWARGRSTAVRLSERARIVLAAAKGQLNGDIAIALNIPTTKVSRWRRRFAERRLDGIRKDLPRGGRPPSAELTRRIIETTTQCTPPERTHWGSRGLAKHLNTSPSTVQRVWRAAGLKPHLVRTFKVSNDPHFVEKLIDVVGLYLNPPEHALVFSADEKSQIQALDRTQKSLPIYKGRCGTMTHDYIRNGTTTLFAALNVLDGKVIGRCMQQHRHQEFIRFLNTVERAVPAGKLVHAIADNYATHKHPKIREWLMRHPRWTFHFTPTSASWLNAVEGYFAKLTKRRLKRGVFRSIVELQAAIKRFLAETNADPRPFRWTKDPDKIIAAVKRGHQVLDSIH